MSIEDWRKLAAYRPLLASSIADIAFEYLRRNPDYRADYRRGQILVGEAAKPTDGCSSSANRWRLVFFGLTPIVRRRINRSSGIQSA